MQRARRVSLDQFLFLGGGCGQTDPLSPVCPSVSSLTSVSLGLMIQKLHKQVMRSLDWLHSIPTGNCFFIAGNESRLMSRLHSNNFNKVVG